jgi:hypothetical protein
MIDLVFIAGWSRELKAMNDGKEGGRYRYPRYLQSFIKLLARGNFLKNPKVK